jgi:hypothetical protein
LCFIDGEHTDKAVLGDARFCLSVLAENGIIMFHDSNLIYGGLQNFLSELEADGRGFRPALVPGSIFLIEFGSPGFCEMEPLRGRVRENYKAYLSGMQANDVFRRAYPLSVDRIVSGSRACYYDFYYNSAICQALRKVKRFFFKSKASKT